MQVRTTVIKEVDLKKLLKAKGLTMYRLAKLSGVDLATISKANAGKLVLTEEAYNKIKFFI